MVNVTVYKPGGGAVYQDVTNVEIAKGLLSFERCPKDSMAYQYEKITTTCPYFMEEKIEKPLY